MQIRAIIVSALAVAMLSSCGFDDEVPEISTASGQLGGRAPVLVQPGQHQILLAVTEDNFVVYQEEGTIYASALVPGARRTVVAQVPEGNLAQPLQVGKVVFLWTNPQRELPGFGVSPLVLWTSHGGPVLLSPQSAVGLVATAASPDSQQLLFTTHVDDDGLRGDLVYARTRAPLAQTTLLADIELNFPNGRCRPLAGFTEGATSLPIALYCDGDDTTGTLAVWERGRKRALIGNVVTPFQFVLESDPDLRTFVVDLADGTIATVELSGRRTVIDHATSFFSFISARGTVGYFSRATATAPANLRLARRGAPPQVLSPVVDLDRETYNGGGYFKPRFLSPDGKQLLYTTGIDPATGLGDKRLLDIDRGTSTVLDAALETVRGSDLFTEDADHALFFVVPDPATGTGQLMAGSRAGSHAVSVGANAFDVFRAGDDNVSFPDNPVFDPALFFHASTADLTVASASDPSVPPRVISKRAGLFYLRSHANRGLVFISGSEPAGQGIYTARACP